MTAGVRLQGTGGWRARRAVAALAILATLACAGCGATTISGSVSTVVSECSELPTDAKATVQVSGNVWEYDAAYDRATPGEPELLSISEGGEDGEEMDTVYCQFSSVSEEDIEKFKPGTRVTVSGTLIPTLTNAHYIWINDCKFD